MTLIEGWFDETLTESTLREHRIEHAGIVMIDCDMYSSAKTALAFCAPLIRDEAVLLFDDWYSAGLADQNLGERRAFEEFLAENPALTAEELDTYSESARVVLVRRG